MKILLLGSGGREHALAWKISQSKHCSKLYIAPGNAGTWQYGENVNINVNDFAAVNTFCLNQEINMLVVGPEEPLVNGVYDYFHLTIPPNGEQLWKGMIIGPSSAGAQLEGSKAFSKKFMHRHNIPTAAYAEFDAMRYEDGKDYIRHHAFPIVLKADGLAAGKGVIICNTEQEALDAFKEMIIEEQFGKASSKVVVEEFLSGIEVSVFVLTNGVDYKIIGHAKDYKRIGEGDTGLNTGGMGCVSPVPFVDDRFMKKVEKKIIQPTIQGLKKESLIYKGFIFFGLININNEPFVIEYNCRLGDPETEVVIPRLQNDLVELFLAVENGTLNDIEIEIDPRTCCTVVAVSQGYPGNYAKGKKISFNNSPSESLIFHAGTKETAEGIFTNGGRVIAVTSFGDNVKDAVDQSKKVLNKIHFDGMYYRKDIGYEFQ